MDKGVALRAIVTERGAGAVLFAGDDLGDLPAFDAVEALRAEGISGVKVCSGSAEVTAVAERADLIVDGPDGIVELINFLADSLAP
jgi:trehalose 6-phosphate phosphatase